MLSENIRVMRKRRGWSQGELAERIHVVRQTVSKWEKNLSVPDAAVLSDLAEVLDTTVGALLGENMPEQETMEQTDAVRELSARLEALNAQMARRSERCRRAWRVVFFALLMLALLVFLWEGLMGFVSWRFTGDLNGAVGVIGGADGPTSIMVSSVSLPGHRLLVGGLLALAAVVGLWGTRRRAG